MTDTWHEIAVSGYPSDNGFRYFCWSPGMNEPEILEYFKTPALIGFCNEFGRWPGITHWMPVRLPTVPNTPASPAEREDRSDRAERTRPCQPGADIVDRIRNWMPNDGVQALESLLCEAREDLVRLSSMIPSDEKEYRMVMKPNEFRDLVNQVRDVALRYHDHQSLRERIVHAMRDAITVETGPKRSQVRDDRGDDAKRYRWLRSTKYQNTSFWRGVVDLRGSEMDAVIDSAMADDAATENG